MTELTDNIDMGIRPRRLRAVHCCWVARLLLALGAVVVLQVLLRTPSRSHPHQRVPARRRPFLELP